MLRISADLELPLDAVTQAIGILARRGAGKTYTASVLVEEVVAARLPVVILDPTGAWWGLRSSASGEKAGLPVVIFGGEHGDVPLEATAGKVIADVVIEHPGAYVIDLSGLESKAAEHRFAADFLERLYRAKATRREPLLVVVDEADGFAPQRPGPEQTRTLGALEAIVRRGRIRGLGVVLVTQRAAVLNKNVLTQIEVLVAMQTTGPQDRAAIDDWIKGNGTPEERAEVLGSLASLEQGEAWVWSPSWLRQLVRVRIRTRRTFDSSKTPEAGQQRVEPRAFAKVDLEQLGDRIRATAETAKANDPAVLRKRIRELEDAAAARATIPQIITGGRLMAIENPVVDDIEGPPCGDCIHQVVCGLRSAYQTFIRARFPIAGELPIGLSWRIAVDCEHFLPAAVAEASPPPIGNVAHFEAGGSPEALLELLADPALDAIGIGRPDARAIEDEGSGDWLADAVRNHEREQTDEPDDADTFTDPVAGLNGGAVETAAEHAFSIPAEEDGSAQPPPPSGSEYAPPISGRQQNEIALAHDSRDDPRPRSAPIGETLVTCEPGCGQQFAQVAIGAHRRTCVAVMEFKAARGVTVVPGLSEAAPLPDPVTTDFDEKRVAHAREAADRTWRQNHVADEVIERAASAKKEIERVSRTPTTPIPPLVAPTVAAPPSGGALTLHQRRVLSTVIRLKGDRKAAAAEIGVVYQSIDVVLEAVGRKGMLPAEVLEKLPARFAKYAQVPS